MLETLACLKIVFLALKITFIHDFFKTNFHYDSEEDDDDSISICEVETMIFAQLVAFVEIPSRYVQGQPPRIVATQLPLQQKI